MTGTTKTVASTNCSLDGWTWYKKEDKSYWSAYGATQGPLDYNPGSSDSRKSWSEQVTVSEAWTETVSGAWTETTGYSYWRYAASGGGGSCCASNISGSSTYVTMSTGVSDRLKATSKTLTCTCHGRFTVYTTTGSASSNVVWWFGESPIITYHEAVTVYHPATYKTVYYYQDRSWVTSYLHYFYKWNGWTTYGAWSDWSKTEIKSGVSTSGSIPNQKQTETNVETRTVYSYRKRP